VEKREILHCQGNGTNVYKILIGKPGRKIEISWKTLTLLRE
jgi:hypothetical protein